MPTMTPPSSSSRIRTRIIISSSNRTLICFLFFALYSSTMTSLFLLGGKRRGKNASLLFASAKSTTTTSTTTTSHSAFVNSPSFGKRRSSSLSFGLSNARRFLETTTRKTTYNDNNNNNFALFSEMPPPRELFMDDDDDDDNDRIYKVLGFSEQEDMAANYNPEEYEAYELPELLGGEDFVSSMEGTSTPNSRSTGGSAAGASSPQKAPPKEAVSPGWKSMSDIDTVPSPSTYSGAGAVSSKSTGYAAKTPKIDANPRFVTAIRDDRSMRDAPVQRESYNRNWDYMADQKEEEEEEVDISNWHPHTGPVDPPPLSTTTTTTTKTSTGDKSPDNNDSKGDGSTVSSISAPLRRQSKPQTTSPPAPSPPPPALSPPPAPAPEARKDDTSDSNSSRQEASAPSMAPPSSLNGSGVGIGGRQQVENKSRPENTRPQNPAPSSTPASPGYATAGPRFYGTSTRNFSTSSDEPRLSREEFRARFSMNDDDDVNDSRPVPPSLSVSQFTNRKTQEDQESMFKTNMESLELQIYALNEGKKFNLKSYKQVSLALFGKPDQSTSKDVLEGMAHKSELAKLILEYRQSSQGLSRLQNLKTKRENQYKIRNQAKMQASTTTTTAATAEAAATDASTTSGGTQQSVAAAATAPSDSLVLVDTSSLIFRAYYSMPPMHREADGMPVSAVLGFCNMLNSLVLNKMLRGERPRLILCLDPSGKNFRHEMYSAYKANRPEAPIDLVPQFSLIYEAARAYGMVTVKATGYEADDVIATLGRQALEENKSVDILSIDKDLWQLVTKPTDDGARIEMLDPITMTQVTHELVEEKWGVPPEKLGDVLALAGDSADNIPGVPGIGPKIAAQLISEFGTLDELLARSDEIPQTKRREKLQANAEQAKLSQGLVRLEHEIPLERLEVIPPREDMDTTSMPITDWRMEPMDADRILAFYDEMGFVTIKRRLLDRLEQQKVVSFRTPARDNVPTRRKKNTSFRDKKSTGMPDPEEYKDVPF